MPESLQEVKDAISWHFATYPWANFWKAMALGGLSFWSCFYAEAAGMLLHPKGPGWPATTHDDGVENPVLPATNPRLRGVDIGFSLVPSFCPVIMKIALADLMLFISIGIGLYRFVFTAKKQEEFLAAARIIVIDSVLVFGRNFFVIQTFLNNPNPRCNNCFTGECPTTWSEAVEHMRQTYPVGLCGALIYSGHTVHFTLLAQAFYYYSKPGALRTFVLIGTVFSLLSLLSCRFHYTIDISVGFVFAIVAFHVYHWIAAGVAVFPPAIQRPIMKGMYFFAENANPYFPSPNEVANWGRLPGQQVRLAFGQLRQDDAAARQPDELPLTVDRDEDDVQLARSPSHPGSGVGTSTTIQRAPASGFDA